MSKLEIPSSFVRSKRSPTLPELEALYDFLEPYNEKIDAPNILEFGCGITSYVISEALYKFYAYVAVETFQPCIDMVKQHCIGIEVVNNWNAIPEEQYDIMFVDGSAGYPENLKPIAPIPACKIPFRNDAIDYTKHMMKPNGIIILHDHNHTYNYQMPRRYLENFQWKLIWEYKGKYGLGAYQLPVWHDNKTIYNTGKI